MYSSGNTSFAVKTVVPPVVGVNTDVLAKSAEPITVPSSVLISVFNLNGRDAVACVVTINVSTSRRLPHSDNCAGGCAFTIKLETICAIPVADINSVIAAIIIFFIFVFLCQNDIEIRCGRWFLHN